MSTDSIEGDTLTPSGSRGKRFALGRDPGDRRWCEALAAKYRTLCALRDARAAGEPTPSRETFRSIAAEFPGALRELDLFPYDELTRRASELSRIASDGNASIPSWMTWVDGYHRWMRLALAIKLRVAHSSNRADASILPFAADAARMLGLSHDDAFARACASPPNGRLRPIVIAYIADQSGGPVREVEAALFPDREPRPLDR